MEEQIFPYKELGEAIKPLREESKITVATIAAECRFSKSRYYEVIKGGMFA